MKSKLRGILKKLLAPILRRRHFRRIGSVYVLRNPPNYLQAYYEYCAGLVQSATESNKLERDFYLITIEFSQILPRKAKYLLIQYEHTIVKIGYTPQRNEMLEPISSGAYSEQYLVRLIGRARDYEKAYGIIDYSRANIEHVKNSNLSDLYGTKVIYIAATFSQLNENWLFDSDQKAPVSMFGNPNFGRRKVFLDSMMKNGVQIENLMGSYSNYYELFKDFGILINVHQTDTHHTLEELRILPALASGLRVISENSPYLEAIPYSNFVEFGAIADLCEKIKELQVERPTEEATAKMRDDFCVMYEVLKKQNYFLMKSLINMKTEYKLETS